MRLTDADELEFVYAILPKDASEDYKEGYGDGMNYVLDIIDDLPTIGPVKWIPVSERLPEPGDWGVSVLVYTVDHEYHVWTAMPYRADNYCWDDEEGYCHDKWEAVAWMPLPEPWKGEEE